MKRQIYLPHLDWDQLLSSEFYFLAFPAFLLNKQTGQNPCWEILLVYLISPNACLITENA